MCSCVLEDMTLYSYFLLFPKVISLIVVFHVLPIFQLLKLLFLHPVAGFLPSLMGFDIVPSI